MVRAKGIGPSSSSMSKEKCKPFWHSLMVRVVGVEPTRSCIQNRQPTPDNHSDCNNEIIKDVFPTTRWISPPTNWRNRTSLVFYPKKNVILYGICYDTLVASKSILVGDTRFERVTFCTQNRRSTRLSQSPKVIRLSTNEP